jgi:biotin-[acetyl-CoA-carboxylase] ligase BirA-like protein
VATQKISLVEIEECSSTQDEVRALFKKNAAPSFLWLRADSQTQGRGRQGHRWKAVKGDALLISVAFRWPAASSAPRSQITLLAGLAIWRVLRKLKSPRPLFLKWPNDIVVGEGPSKILKVGGILAEAKGEDVVVGWGLNLRGKPKLKSATSLEQLGLKSLPRTQALALALAKSFESLAQDYFQNHARLWPQLHRELQGKAMAELWGRKLKFLKTHRGTAMELDKDGALILKQSSGLKRLR